MLGKGVFTVSIGNHGVAISLHQGKKVSEKLFVDNITDENSNQIRQVFIRNK
jgi:hypothetical protein